MTLASEQSTRYEQDGFLVLPDFVDHSTCDQLRKRADELVRDFDPQGVISIFSTQEQTRTSDDYFLESGDKIRFFFEENAFLLDGTLRQSKERSINKIGHALHDLDPVFGKFSRTDKIKQLVSDLGIADPLLLQSMYIFKQPNNCGLKSRFVRADGGGTRFEVFDNTPWPEEKLQPLEVEKGTLIVLHPLLPHLSRENASPRSRHAYTLHVIDASAHYSNDNWLQRSPEMPLRGF